MRNADAKTQRERVETMARILDISHLLDRKPRQLSGGQQQRVALGRAIARQPQVFLLDEPLSNLDAQLRDGTRSELKQLHQQVGITTIYVTHDQVEAMTLADQIVILERGKDSADWRSAQSIYAQPDKPHGCNFFGQSGDEHFASYLPGRGVSHSRTEDSLPVNAATLAARWTAV